MNLLPEDGSAAACSALQPYFYVLCLCLKDRKIVVSRLVDWMQTGRRNKAARAKQTDLFSTGQTPFSFKSFLTNS